MKLLSALGLMAVSGASMAALPSGVTTAIEGAGTDASTALAAIIVVAVGIWALKRVKALF